MKKRILIKALLFFLLICFHRYGVSNPINPDIYGAINLMETTGFGSCELDHTSLNTVTSSSNFLDFPLSDGFTDGDSLVLFAGNDTTICLTSLSFDVRGYAENFYYTAWKTTGDGFFLEMTNLNTAYVPGADEIANGLATLYLIGICVEPDYFRFIDSVNVSIVIAPQCFAGTDAFICDGEPFQISAQAFSFADLLWSSSGDGTFDEPSQLNPVYHHGILDLMNGEVLLTLTASEISPCVTPNQNMVTLSIFKSPEVYVGADTIICEGSTLQLDATAINYDEIHWTTNGNGTFSNFSIVNPVYFPGDQDIQTGGVELYVTASPELPCDVFEVGQQTLTIQKNPTIDIGLNRTICENQSLQCTAIVENYASLQWSVFGGTGYFDDPHTKNPVYYPGDHERITGSAFIYLEANSINPCIGYESASFELRLKNNAFVSAGEDQIICETDVAVVFGEAENYQVSYWETMGDGSFIESENISSDYIPGPLDIEYGSIELFLSVVPFSPCYTFACDTVLISIQKFAFIDAGPDATVCEDVFLPGTSSYASEFYWITSGDGDFLNPENLNTHYYAGDQDLENQQVTLTLMALSNEPCGQVVTDDVLLVFDTPSLVSNNLHDKEIFSGESINLYFEASSMYELTYQWFINDNPINNANTSHLSIDNSAPIDAGSYYCMYANACYEYSSDTANIVIWESSSQIIPLSNGWNAISSFIQPANTNIEVVLSPILSELIFIYGEEGVFWPGQDMQTFYSWSSSSAYILKTSAGNDLLIQGYIKHPFEEILLSPGWTSFPVNSRCPLATLDLLAAYPELTIIKEIGGCKICWPEKGIFTLENINPGKAYEIFNASNIEISLTFPGCEE